MADNKQTNADEAKKKAAEQSAKAETTCSEHAAKPVSKLAKGEEGSVTDATPYPTQADLDAIKEGRHNREITAENSGSEYKTR